MDKAVLRIAHWNSNSVRNKKNEITMFIEEEDVDIMLISETYLKTKDKFKIRNYDVYRKDRENGHGGGTAILIKRKIKHGEMAEIEEGNVEGNGIKVQTKRGEIIIYSAYKSPSKAITEEDIAKFFKSNKPTIVAGDLNCKHTEWNCKKGNTCGSELRKIKNNLGINILAPEEPTHICENNNHSNDILDIALVKNWRYNTDIEVKMDLSSDHCPVMMEVELDPTEYNSKRKIINWNKFRETMIAKKFTINKQEELEERIIDLEERIKVAMEKSSRTEEDIKRRNRLPANLQQLKKEKRKAKKTYMKTLNPDDKRKLNTLTQKLREEINELANIEWEQKIENLQEEDLSLWKMARSLTGKKSMRKIPNISYKGKSATLDSEKAEMFAEMLKEQFTPNKPNGEVNFNKNIENQGKRRLETDDNQEIEKIEKEEVISIIKQTKTRKAPGKDGITNKAIKMLPEEAMDEIIEIANSVLKFEKFPEVWKTSETIMIHKKGKPNKEAESYRPINLLPSLSKIIEKTIVKRLKKHTEEKEIIPTHQFGFRESYSTIHQLAKITEEIKEKLNLSRPTGMILLDIEKAFDKVWHNGLIYKMRESKFPNKLINIIQSYLEKRHVKIRIGEETSSEIEIKAGVPQGSVLGPTLFNIYISDIPRNLNAKIAQFADDTAIYLTHRNKTSMTKQLQEDMEKLDKYFKKWRIKVNETKTEAIYFDHKRRNKKPQEIEFNKEKIKWKKTVKYLGLNLNKYLNYKEQTNENIKTAKKLQGALYPLLNRKSKLSIKNKIRIIETIIEPAILYGSEIWMTQSNSESIKLQSKINKVIRTAVDAPWYITNDQIRRDLGIKTLKDKTEKKTLKFLNKIETHQNEEIKKITLHPTRKTDKIPTLMQWKRTAEENMERETQKRTRNQ